ncbi:MAG TPA: hypothetical protein VGP82_00905 [Ktedonobacterales bacterium]|jgi:hypothetical protein|nr:hypothetical protein [Ktedonobacterales bacterium]
MAYDTQASREGNMPVAMPDERQFIEGDVTRLYSRMRSDQRTAVGNELLRLLRLSGDDTEGEREATGMLSAQEVARLHTYTRERHPEILHDVWNHPVTQASLAAPGAEAEPVEHEDVIEQVPRDVPQGGSATRNEAEDALRETQWEGPHG